MFSIGRCSHSTLRLSKVNGHALMYEWEGSDTNLKSLLLTAHQGSNMLKLIYVTHNLTGCPLPDVVPVDPTTVDQWTQPPFSGYFDGLSLCF